MQTKKRMQKQGKKKNLDGKIEEKKNTKWKSKKKMKRWKRKIKWKAGNEEEEPQIIK